VLSFVKIENDVVCLNIQYYIVVSTPVHEINLECSHEIVTILWHNSLHELEHTSIFHPWFCLVFFSRNQTSLRTICTKKFRLHCYILFVLLLLVIFLMFLYPFSTKQFCKIFTEALFSLFFRDLKKGNGQ
jgi:hypothetical protein